MHIRTHLILDTVAIVDGQRWPVDLDAVRLVLRAVETTYEFGMRAALTSRLPVEFARDERGRRQLLGVTPDVCAAFPGTACPTPFRQLLIPAT